MEYKYYLEKINKILEDEENHSLLSSYLNSKDIKEDCQENNFKNEIKKNILMLLSTNYNTSFTKKYTQNIIDNVENLEAQKQKILLKDLESQDENFKERLKIKNQKLPKPHNNYNSHKTSNINGYLTDNFKRIEGKQPKVRYFLIKPD